MSIHERIREIRQALGLSQAKFAKDISISSGYVAGLELGNRKVNNRMIKLICTQYNVNEAWLRVAPAKCSAAHRTVGWNASSRCFTSWNRPFRITFWNRPTACLPCKTAVRRKIARKTIKSHGLPSQTERSPWLLFESFSILPRHAGML